MLFVNWQNFMGEFMMFNDVDAYRKAYRVEKKAQVKKNLAADLDEWAGG